MYNSPYYTTRIPEYLNKLSYIDYEGKAKVYGLGLLLLFLYIGLIFFGIFSIPWLFPRLTFVIGGQIEVHNRRIQLRKNLLWVVVVGSIVSIVVGVILQLIKIT